MAREVRWEGDNEFWIEIPEPIVPPDISGAPDSTGWYDVYAAPQQLGRDVLAPLVSGEIGSRVSWGPGSTTVDGVGGFVNGPPAYMAGDRHEFFEAVRVGENRIEVFGPDSQGPADGRAGKIVNVFDGQGKYLDSYTGGAFTGHWKQGLWVPVTLATAGITGLLSPVTAGTTAAEAATVATTAAETTAGSSAGLSGGLFDIGLSGNIPLNAAGLGVSPTAGFGLTTSALAPVSTFGGAAIGGGLAASLVAAGQTGLSLADIAKAASTVKTAASIAQQGASLFGGKNGGASSPLIPVGSAGGSAGGGGNSAFPALQIAPIAVPVSSTPAAGAGVSAAQPQAVSAGSSTLLILALAGAAVFAAIVAVRK